jgi:hypothetical protein
MGSTAATGVTSTIAENAVLKTAVTENGRDKELIGLRMGGMLE